MNRKLLCISGWGQKYDSLESIFTDPIFHDLSVSSLNYFSFQNFDHLVSEYNFSKINPNIVIGWSLGGQIAIRLIEKKVIAPKLLILIAPPFQMIKSNNIQAGMPLQSFLEFHKNFCDAPTKTLKQFSILTAMNDRNASEISRSLNINDDNFKNMESWLDELKKFSCFDVDFSDMPRVIYFHGYGDMIVHHSQSELFKNRISDFRLEVFRNCGHAPHISHIEDMKKIIFSELYE